MISLDAASSLAAARDLRLSRRVTPALYVVTLFVSALLLFAVQPMFTKMVLPRLGGSPSVWSVAMVAFQTFCSPDMPMRTWSPGCLSPPKPRWCISPSWRWSR